MTQAELDRAVAAATGETICTIRTRGFSLFEVPEPAPRIVDWDELDAARVGILPEPRRSQQRAAA